MFDENKYYDVQVVSDEIDPNKNGAVRVKILGYTDTYDDGDQPFVLPALLGTFAVPETGSKLQVKFDNGDINMGRYYFVSVDDKYIPKDYRDNYPYVAITNLGTFNFYMTHDRSTNTTTINHPSNTTITINELGEITHDAESGYTNTEGKVFPVITGASIDIFTCTPIGAGQGSEYLSITHISKNTVAEINGAVAKKPDYPLTYTEESYESRELFNIDGSPNGTVEFLSTESYAKNPSKVCDKIIIVHSNDMTFSAISSKFMTESESLSCHYLIGEFPLTDNSSDADGFAQFVNFEDEVIYKPTVTMNDGTPINKNSVIIMLINDGILPVSDYQYETLNMLIASIRWVSNDPSVAVYVPTDITLLGMNMKIDKSKLI